MATTISRRLQDCVLGLFSLGFVLAGLAYINESVRQYLIDVLHGNFTTIVPGVRVHQVTKHVVDMIPALHPELAAFAVAALILTIIMFRV
jgi:hypothetical protein